MSADFIQPTTDQLYGRWKNDFLAIESFIKQHETRINILAIKVSLVNIKSAELFKFQADDDFDVSIEEKCSAVAKKILKRNMILHNAQFCSYPL